MVRFAGNNLMPFKWLRPFIKPAPEAVAAPRPAAGPPPAWTVAAALDRRPRVLALSSATRDYDRAIQAGTFDRMCARDLAVLVDAMGPEIWSWQRARRLTDQAPWRAGSEVDEREERTRAWERMTKDLGTWEKALSVLDARIARARLYDKPVPPPLVVPAAIMMQIKAKREAALERATRVKARGEAGGSPPALKPDDDLQHVPFPSKPM
jgi:hypothetical protein